MLSFVEMLSFEMAHRGQRPVIWNTHKLTSTRIVPDRRRAPKTISNEPIRKRNTARAIALYGTFGGLFLNCLVFLRKKQITCPGSQLLKLTSHGTQLKRCPHFSLLSYEKGTDVLPVSLSNHHHQQPVVNTWPCCWASQHPTYCFWLHSLLELPEKTCTQRSIIWNTLTDIWVVTYLFKVTDHRKESFWGPSYDLSNSRQLLNTRSHIYTCSLCIQRLFSWSGFSLAHNAYF